MKNMKLQSESFDAVAYETEAHLRELRRLLGGTLFMSDAQTVALNDLRASLLTMEARASALRHSLLTGQDPADVHTKPVGEMEPVTTL